MCLNDKTAVLTLAVACICGLSGNDLDGQEQVGKVTRIRPKGEFRQIDLVPTADLMVRLDGTDAEDREASIVEAIAHPGKYAPPAYYALSNALADTGKKDDAVFWYYWGQVRARSDANKCNDLSAREAVYLLNMKYGPKVIPHAFRDFDKVRKTLDRVVERDRKEVREYDPRWIALHGMGAFLDEKPAFEPKEKWAEIDEATRVNHVADLAKAMEEGGVIKKLDLNGDGGISEEEEEAAKKATQEESEQLFASPKESAGPQAELTKP